MTLNDLLLNSDEVIPYQYDKIKSPEFDAIIAKYLAQAPSVSRPTLFHMAGIPGAGKTTFYHTHTWPQHILIAFDDIMEEIKGYRQDQKALGNAAAFAKWEITARIIGYELLRRVVESKKNIFFDHGGSNQAHINLMKNIKNFGYQSEMHYISCPLQTAISRAAVREKEINRHIPVETIKERYVKTLDNIKKYQKIVDRFYQHNTDISPHKKNKMKAATK